MKIILETERLILRTFTADDAKMFYDLCSDPKLLEFADDKSLKSEEEALGVLTEKILIDEYEKCGYGRWAVHIKKNGLFTGWCGLQLKNGETELQYRLKKKFWGKGFATEAVSAVLKYGFQDLGIGRIQARTHSKNTAGIEVMKRTGMNLVQNNSPDSQNCVHYELTREQWIKKLSADG